MLDPKQHADWEIAQEAEKTMKTVYQLGKDLGLADSELLPYGHYMGKIDYRAVLNRLADKPNGKYIDVTAITPTPLGEGKSTTTIGLADGLSRIGKDVTVALREPSLGPVFGVKGGAAGGVACNESGQYATSFTLVNSIVWGNTVAGEPNDAGECRETCRYSYSCFREAADYPEAHNIAVDPKVRAETGRPSLLTPCRDIGLALPWHATGVDLEGGIRVLGAGVDLGCFEVKDGGMIIFVR